MTFSRRSIHSHRANSSTCILLSFGIAAKSKLSRLLTTGNWRLDPAIDLSAIAFDHLPLTKSEQISDMIDAFGGA